MGDWLPLLGIAVVAVAYAAALGSRPKATRRPTPELRGAAPRGAAPAFLAGLATAAFALSPPFHQVADRSFTAHMVQHVLLIAVVAPLLVLGQPGVVLLQALAPATRRRWRTATAGGRRSVRSLPWGPSAMGAIALQALVMWSWHAPVLFEAALRSDTVHSLEHASLLATSMAVWWALLRGRHSHRGAAALALFVAAFPGTALGAALLLAPRPWFPSYAQGGAPAGLADQQLAGVVMWSVAGIAYVIGAAVLFGTWLARDSRFLPSGTVAPAAPGREGENYAY